MSDRFYRTADVKKASATTVEIRRSFNAKPEMVYRAYTEPDLMRRWLTAYPGWEMPVCEMDLREGGKYRWRWVNAAQKSEFGFDGVFKKVMPGERLDQTQTFDPGTMGGDMGKECYISQRFLGDKGTTTVITVIDYQSSEDMEQALSTGMTDGMEASYQNLEKVFER